MRRALILLVLAAALWTGAAPAHAARIVVFSTTSRYVEPASVAFNNPPCHEPARPKELSVNVMLPDGYDKGGRWPVLWLLHGHGDSYSAWAAPCNGDLLNVARGLPAVVVMPEAAQGWYADWWNGGERAAPAWERYHLDELLPLVEKRFRIRRGRRWHAIAGLSMGGEGAMYYAEQRPGYFGSVASFSGPLAIQRPEYANGGMDTQGQKFTDVFGPVDGFWATANNPAANAANLRHTRVYVTVGDGRGSFDELSNYFGTVAEADLHQHAEDFVAAARAAGVDVTYVPRDGVHDWPYWREHLAAAVRWGFFRPVVPAPLSWSVQTASQTGDAWGFRWVFDVAPSSLVVFARDGNRISATGSGTVVLRTPQGARFRATLPFEREIPRAPKRRPKRRR
jgi:S-formylglutathione hydrolase FrmB